MWLLTDLDCSLSRRLQSVSVPLSATTPEGAPRADQEGPSRVSVPGLALAPAPGWERAGDHVTKLR